MLFICSSSVSIWKVKCKQQKWLYFSTPLNHTLGSSSRLKGSTHHSSMYTTKQGPLGRFFLLDHYIIYRNRYVCSEATALLDRLKCRACTTGRSWGRLSLRPSSSSPYSLWRPHISAPKKNTKINWVKNKSGFRFHPW